MCGRFVSATPPDQLAKYFGAEVLHPRSTLLEPNYNVAPYPGHIHRSTRTATCSRRMDTFHWGLVPFWAKDPGIGNRMINARAETLAEKNSYKRPFANGSAASSPPTASTSGGRSRARRRSSRCTSRRSDGDTVRVRWALGDLVRPQSHRRRRRADGVVLVHDHHRVSRTRQDGGDPPPHAGDAAARRPGTAGSIATGLTDVDEVAIAAW